MKLAALVILAACGGPAAPGSDAAPGSGSGSADDRLYPLEVGRTWTYQVTSTYSSCPAGVQMQSVDSTGMTDGRATFAVKSFCGPVGNTAVDGNVVDAYFNWGPTGWTRMLDEPVAADHTWTTTNGSATFTMTYSDAGTVDGHASCWKVTQNVSYTTYWIYCPGVGMVEYDMVDLAGGTIHAVLQGTSF